MMGSNVKSKKSATQSLSRLRGTSALMRVGIDLMKEERQAIVSGAFDMLEELARKKTDLLAEIDKRFSAIETGDTSDGARALRAELVGLGNILSRRAAENLNLLESARQGVSTALGELADADSADHAPGFYASSGQKIPTPGHTGSKSLKL